MTKTTTSQLTRHWSYALRFLAPGPVALGTLGWISPTAWAAVRASIDRPEQPGPNE